MAVLRPPETENMLETVITAHVTTDHFTHQRRALGNSRKQLQSPAMLGTRLLELQ